jgi:hypothetical protein
MSDTPDTPPPVPRPEVVAWLKEAIRIAPYTHENFHERIALYRAALRDVEAMGAASKASDVWLTTGRPEFGIECTVAHGEQYRTVTNQPDVADAILAAAAPPGAEP